MSQVLRDARRFEEERGAFISPEERPDFHLSARVGWMNDPNGFSFYNGRYHLFYQYHPYDSHWGPIHWGHAVSDDLLHWEYLPAAMAPDAFYDRDGCFSGSAITVPGGRQLLMYTGIVFENAADGTRQQLQTQNIAFGDGLNYEKYSGNPVLTAEDLPEGGSRYGFRDPKIWKKRDGTYRALVANDREGHGGQLLLYRSRDALEWEFDHVFVENHYRIGRMWECPDFFELDGTHVVLISSQDMLPKGLEYHNGNGSFYYLGNYNEEKEIFTPTTDHAVDYGIDFYAPQTILTPDGRRVMIGWMQNWDTCNLHTKSTPWFGQMSIPRELFIKDGILHQRPIRELERLRGNPVSYRNVELEGGWIHLPGISGRKIDLDLKIIMEESAGVYERFVIRFAENTKFFSEVIFFPHESTLKIDRKFSGSRRAVVHQRRAIVPQRGGNIRLRMILDRYSCEIFVNGGEKVLSMTYYTDLDADGISFFADGKASMDVVMYPLDQEPSGVSAL
ncbi:MAG: glycoside hydrolase family 32 protein [Anaerovoracaceae bacterium]|jgi:sucrose-6-phosphate hydrolase